MIPKTKGKIFVVATPIGNMEDISLRALRTLKEADIILCEDTRVSGKLLKHYEIETKLVPFNARNEERKIAEVISQIESGAIVALISDAGTPTISDPGVRLVNSCLQKGIEVTGIPGPNAAILALSIAGIPTDSFVFEGFLPQKKGRKKKLKEICEEKRTVVLYESVYRIKKLLDELEEFCPNRFAALARELTKKFEELLRGTPAQLREKLGKQQRKGEFVVILAPLDWINR